MLLRRNTMSQTTYQTIEVHPVSGLLGAEIKGVNLADLNDEQFTEIRQVFLEHSVIFFRDQDLTQEQHIAFANRWGEINVNHFFKPVEDYPMIAEVSKEPDQERNIGSNWHTDHSYDQIPALGSILYAHEVPEVGGDTMFASMYAAYDALPDGLKETLSGLNAIHSSRHAFGRKPTGQRSQDIGNRIGNRELATQDAVHPVVIRHPDTGRKALYINSAFTVQFEGWTKEESQPLLQYLYRHAVNPTFTCRFQWKKGSVGFWDNRATWHCALNDYPGQRRYMHRITVEGVSLS